jgi:hypothetical protein
MSGEAKVAGIGIFCSDPRANLWKAIKRELISPSKTIIPLGFLGGPICLANRGDLQKELNFLLSQIHFALGVFPGVKDFLVVGHDCGFYKLIPWKEFSLADKKKDLARAANFLRKRFPQLTTTAHFKDTQGDGFEKIA